MKRRLLSLVLSLVMVLSMTAGITASAASEIHTGQADMLYQMGLFKGTGTNPDGTPIYNLDAGATRMQGLIMLIRLLGEEQDALAYVGECPFTDVSGTSALYAGYAYSKGYTTGTTPTTFGNGPLKANAFLTFCLRSLGFDDKNGDFTYGTAFLKAAEIGLIGPGEFTNQSTTLLRSGCVQIAHNALLTKVKGSDQTLINKLVADGAVDKAKAEQSGIFKTQRFSSMFGRDYFALQNTALNRYGSAPLANAKYYGLEGIKWIDSPKTEAEYINNIKYAFLVGDYNLAFAFKTDEESSAFIEFADNEYMGGNLKEIYKTFPELMGSHINGNADLMMGSSFYWFGIRNPSLSNTEIYQQQQEALAKALEISKSLHESGKITDTMSKKDIVQVYYDYMRSYGVKPYNGYNSKDRGVNMQFDTAYSALVKKEAACSGRAAAFALLMHIEEIPCATVSCHMKGAPKDDGHGVNYVVIDGVEYVVDYGNNKPLQTLDEAKSYLDEINQYSLGLARAATK